MTPIRFLFGHGWFVLWHAAFYFVLLVFVVMVFIMFAQDLKRRGQKPDLPSPASIMVLMIALGLSLLTLIDGYVFVAVAKLPLWAKLFAPICMAMIVGASTAPLNLLLATRQSHASFWANIVIAILFVAANLTLLWFGETRPRGGVGMPFALKMAGAITVVAISSVVTALAFGEAPVHFDAATTSRASDRADGAEHA